MFKLWKRFDNVNVRVYFTDSQSRVKENNAGSWEINTMKKKIIKRSQFTPTSITSHTSPQILREYDNINAQSDKYINQNI